MWASSPTGYNMRCGAGLGGGVRAPRPYEGVGERTSQERGWEMRG